MLNANEVRSTNPLAPGPRAQSHLFNMANHHHGLRKLISASPTYSLPVCRFASTAPRARNLASPLSRLMANPPPPQQTGLLRPEFPLKKEWPPNFSKLSVQEHFRYEKKFNRRVAYATRRPVWNKTIQIIQVVMAASKCGEGLENDE